MRLALTHAYSWPEVRRGAERIIQELSRSLAKRGHDVTVFTTGAKASTTIGSGVTTVRFRRRFDSAQRHEAYFATVLVPRLFRGRFDAVHSLGPRDALASIRASRLNRRRGHRTVYTNLGYPEKAWWDKQPDRKAHERVVRDVDVYGCMSQYSLRALSRDYGRPGVLTPGGVNLSEFTPAEQRSAEPTVLFSGALDEPRKGVAVLLQGCSIAAREHPELRVWLSGPGDASALLSNAPPEIRSNVELLPIGDPTGQASRYGQAWATALPSKGDSFGMVVIESLACGTPVVVSNDWALPELVVDGQTGALCDPDDASSVAAAVLQTLDLAHRPGTADACRATAARYDWDAAIAPAFERLYSGEVSEPAGPGRPSG